MSQEDKYGDEKMHEILNGLMLSAMLILMISALKLIDKYLIYIQFVKCNGKIL